MSTAVMQFVKEVNERLEVKPDESVPLWLVGPMMRLCLEARDTALPLSPAPAAEIPAEPEKPRRGGKRNWTPEQRDAARERMKNMRRKHGTAVESAVEGVASPPAPGFRDEATGEVDRDAGGGIPANEEPGDSL